MAASNSPGVGIVSRSDFTAPVSSSLVKAGPVGSGAASSAERTYVGQAIAPAMHTPAVSLRRVLIMDGRLGKVGAACRWNIEAGRLRGRAGQDYSASGAFRRVAILE